MTTTDTPTTGASVGTPAYVLHLGDCLEVMRGLADNSVDSVVTDPPYNEVNRESGGLRLFDKGIADSAPIDIPVLAQAFVRLAKGSIYVWCGTEQASAWRASFVKLGLSTRTGVWIKTNPAPTNGDKLWLSGIELCVFARKSNAPFYRFCAVPEWRGPSERIDNFPCPKPVWLMEELITASVPKGGIVLDAFMGSGTTGVACVNTDRRFIGIEREAEYMAICEKRIGHAASQGRQTSFLEAIA